MILIGEKNENIKYDFRETVFGICLRNEELYLTKKGEDISLIGGGIESNETEETTLKREALEEAGLVKMSINEAKNQLKLPYQKQGLTEFLNKIK